LEIKNPNRNVYFKAIDGLRAISFIIVFLYHCDLQFMRIGWAGVIVFFVISGFLITNILLNQPKKEGYFIKFFTKRVIRIAPASIIVLCVCSFVFYVNHNKIPNDWIYYLFNIQNFLWLFSKTTLDLNGYLGHTWTLAIEEQFYLLWPFIIFYMPRKKIGWLCLSVVIASLVYRGVASQIFHNTLAVTVMLISHADSLALGCLLAYIINEHSESKTVNLLLKFSLPAGFLGIILILLYLSITYGISLKDSYYLLNDPNKYLINGFTSQIFFFVALFSLGLVHSIITNPASFISKLLESKILVHFGLISYGMYIYHWPILVFIKQQTSDVSTIVFAGWVATYGVSLFSYHTVEKFFRLNKQLILNKVTLLLTMCRLKIARKNHTS
jgi:peptidoglycan/LPS O-acetylase OafA/YrhL